MSREKNARERIANRLKTMKTAASSGKDKKPTPSRTKQRPERDTERQSAFKFGQIISGGTEHVCIIKDISSTGARIILEGAIVLPTDVMLRIGKSSATRPCRVAWQKDREAGLAF